MQYSRILIFCGFLSFVPFSATAASTTLSAREKIQHLLNRFSYGPKPGEIELLEKSGSKAAEEWFNKQLNINLSSVEEKIDSKLKTFSSLRYTNEEMLKAFPQKNRAKKMKMSVEDIEGPPKEIIIELTIQKLLRAVESDRQLFEVMSDFWFNHFNVYFDKGVVRQSITSYERDVIRPHIFGTFEELLIATAKSPAMLMYLDNNSSRNGKINENYARELLELHTLGVDGGYTQKDIQETARVLTGWGVEKPRLISKFKFFKGQHDKGPKKILELNFLGDEGITEGEKLIHYLANHPKTAEFIAKKLAVKFVSDNPKPETVRAIADTFKKTGGNLKEVYRSLITTEEFFSHESLRSKIKTPLEYFASAARTTGATFNPSTEKIGLIKGFFDQSGQSLYRCQPPTGYKAVSEFWVSPGALVHRINFALDFTRGKMNQLSLPLSEINSGLQNKKFKSQLPLLEYYNKNYFNDLVKADTLKKIDSLLDESKNYQGEEVKELPLYYFNTGRLIGLMLASPEFQRR